MQAMYACICALLTMLNQPAPTPRSAVPRVSRGAHRTTPTTVARATDCGGWRQLVARHNWPVDTACRILLCESGGNPNARNGRYVGLFQVGNGTTNPERNVAQAYAMWSARGWRPWECKP